MREPGQTKARPHDPSLARLVIDDLRRARNLGTMWREIKDLYGFYLDEEDRARLSEMGRIKRAFWVLGWLFKSLLLKLSPARRLMLLAALVLAVMGPTRLSLPGSGSLMADLRPWAIALLLIVLMLELKDKLVARDEIEIARQVQLALLPQTQPQISGWAVWSYTRPANDVGGDLVDYIPRGDERLGVALGDVAGKGLGAALLAAKLQATMRALIPEYRDLSQLGDLLNSILYRDGLDNRFATLFYMELEHHTGRLRYLNAGHNPACVMRRGGFDQLGASSLPLGMIPGSKYQEGTLELEPGEGLLIYSDGLTEAANEADEEFGMDRLIGLLPQIQDLSPHQAGTRLLAEVDRFLGDNNPGDDLSLVLVQRLH